MSTSPERNKNAVHGCYGYRNKLVCQGQQEEGNSGRFTYPGNENPGIITPPVFHYEPSRIEPCQHEDGGNRKGKESPNQNLGSSCLRSERWVYRSLFLPLELFGGGTIITKKISSILQVNPAIRRERGIIQEQKHHYCTSRLGQ
jgi:hypothetical protein